MKIAKHFRMLMLLGILAISLPTNSIAAEITPKIEDRQRVEALNKRLEEIKSIDSKELTRAEKKALRAEVRQIKKEMAEISGGVYLSVGAIILIALLLILLL